MDVASGLEASFRGLEAVFLRFKPGALDAGAVDLRLEGCLLGIVRIALGSGSSSSSELSTSYTCLPVLRFRG